jgi:hypothetical protein
VCEAEPSSTISLAAQFGGGDLLLQPGVSATLLYLGSRQPCPWVLCSFDIYQEHGIYMAYTQKERYHPYHSFGGYLFMGRLKLAAFAWRALVELFDLVAPEAVFVRIVPRAQHQTISIIILPWSWRWVRGGRESEPSPIKSDLGIPTHRYAVVCTKHLGRHGFQNFPIHTLTPQASSFVITLVDPFTTVQHYAEQHDTAVIAICILRIRECQMA